MHMSVNMRSGVRSIVRSTFGKGTTWFGLLFLVVWTVFVAGCGGDDTNVTPMTTDSGTDAKKDQYVAPDVGKDTYVAPEVGPEADAGGDAPTDRADAPVDAPADNFKADVADAPVDTFKADVADAPVDTFKADVADAQPVTLSSIEVTPANSSILQLTQQQFTATGHYSDNTTANLTAQVMWQSSQASIATINAAGLATATNTTGTTTITATLGTKTGSTNLTVSTAPLVTIEVTPPNVTIAPTTTQAYKATGTYGNGSTQDLTALVMWSSSNTGVATINSSGVATGVVTGQTTISAVYQAITGTTTLHVQAVNIISINVTPGSPSIPLGLTQAFTATATFDDASTQDITNTAMWASSVTATATISATGVATSVAPGTTIISATQGGVTGLATLEVTAARLDQIVVSAPKFTIADGTFVDFTATGIYSDNTQQDLTVQAAWVSSNTSVATVSSGPNDGRATAVDPGDAVISASYLGVTGSAVLHVTPAVLKEIQVTPPTMSIAKGTTTPFTATGVYTDNSTQDLTTAVAWTSDTAAVATVSAAGVAKGEGVGTAIITATQGAIHGQATLTVTAATLVSIDVTPKSPAPSIPNGLDVQFTAIGTYTDNSTQNLTATANWHSSNTAVATISATGLASADSLGTTTITADQDSVTSNAVVLTVTDAVLQTITVTPNPASIPDGLTLQFHADGHYSDGTTVDLTTQATWTSATLSVATINPTTGLAQAVDPGTSVITAAMGTISGTRTLTVTTAVLQTITVDPVNSCIANSSTQQFIATGHFTDGSTVNLTGVALWASSVTSVASISNAGPTRGVATAGVVASGTQQTTISATYDPGSGTVSGSTTLSVGACTVPSPKPRPNR
jgi:hypothetical protein